MNKRYAATPEKTITSTLRITSSSAGPPWATMTGAGCEGDDDAETGAGGDGILGMSAVWSLTVGRATAVAALVAGAADAATVDGGWESGWARTVGGGTAGAAGLVAPATLPVVFFNREVSFFGMIGAAGIVEGSLEAPPGGGAPALDGGTGRGGNVIRTVSFFSVGLLAPPAEGVCSAIVTSLSFAQYNRHSGSVKIFLR